MTREKGFKHAEETKKKMSLAHRGKILSEKTKLRMSKSKLKLKQERGYINSEETRRKMSEKRKGKTYEEIYGKEKAREIKKEKSANQKAKDKRRKTLKDRGITPPKKFWFEKGSLPWNYIDGRSKIKSPDRYGDDWDKVRLLVYARDNFMCQDCGKTMNEMGKPLDVHHKIPFLISFDNSLKNLISLCRSCHRQEESRIMKELKNQKVEV